MLGMGCQARGLVCLQGGEVKSHLMAFAHMDCGCVPDEDLDFLNVCPKHFYAHKLYEILIRQRNEGLLNVPDQALLQHIESELAQDVQ